MNEIECPQCKSKAYKRNGYTRHGKQNLRCLDCGRQFSVEPFTQQTSAGSTEIHSITRSSDIAISTAR